MRSPPRFTHRGFSLLLVMFVLTLMGVTLLTLSGHFTQTARVAQMARMETQAAQILQSGLAWARVHQTDLAARNMPARFDTHAIAGPGVQATLSWTRIVDEKGWQLTVTLTHGRQRLTRSTIFHPPSPESNAADSR